MVDQSHRKEPSITGINSRVIISFVVAITLISIGTLVSIVLIVLNTDNPGDAALYVGGLITFVGSLVSSITGFGTMFFQLRAEMNHRFDQLVKAKADLGYNEGLISGEAGEMDRRGREEQVSKESQSTSA